MIKALEKMLAKIAKQPRSDVPTRLELKFLKELSYLRRNDNDLFMRYYHRYTEVMNSKLTTD